MPFGGRITRQKGHTKLMAKSCRLAIGVLGLLAVATASADDPRPAEQVEFFEKKIRPILVEHCYKCHSAASKTAKGGLILDTRDGLRKGGDSGPALEAGAPDESLLIKAVRYTDKELRMPPKTRLAPGQVADLEAWVKMGAPDPRTETTAAAPAKPAMDFEAARRFWSFQPPREQPLPDVKRKEWPRNPIDHFILARLEEKGLTPTSDADKRTLIRRATFDLIGLPPTPEEVDAFVADRSSDAYAKVVDRLLASPHYGERWGRHWLDVARYADTAGDDADYPVPQAYRYRNYVIDAFNKDKPYDQFIREQIAGDLLGGRTEEERYERIVATGFLALARRSGEDPDKEPHITLDDAIDTLGKTILGISLSCARCHDHKFDPIPKEDYYAIYGILASSRFAYAGSDHKKYQRDFVPLLPQDQADRIARPFDERLAFLEAQLAPLDKEAQDFEKALGGIVQDSSAKAKKRTLKELKDALQAAQKECEKFGKTRPDYPDAFAVSEGIAGNARVQIAGNPSKLGAEVPRGFVQVLGGGKVPADEQGSGRRQLAEWLTDPRNPVTARVMVNRLWQHHFGRGLVQTPDVFGKQGKPPTHPELLDFLANQLVQSGWSIKAMHRQMLLSHTYRLSAGEDAANSRIDPTNQLWWRADCRRLGAEAIRDSLLAVSGELERGVAGAHPFPPRKDWNYGGAAPFKAVYETKRRSIYLLQPRVTRDSFLALFDGADANFSVGQRFESTTSVQALYLMNSPFVSEQARAFAGRLAKLRPDDGGRIELAHRLLFGRPASPEETADGLHYLEKLNRLVPGSDEVPEVVPKQREMLVATAHEDPVTWRYVFQAPPKEWSEKAFQDAAWSEGSAGFAPRKSFREPEFIARTVWDTPEIWLRRRFALPERRWEHPWLRVNHGGPAEVYLNGVLAADLKGRSNGYAHFEIRKQALATLKSGENLLAIHCHGAGAGQFVDAGLVERAGSQDDAPAAWTSYLRVLMSSNEFFYVD